MISADLVWEALNEQFSVDIPLSMRQSHAFNGSWTLTNCTGCGLHYFSDAVEGDAAFYELLGQSEAYYEVSRWEFDVVRSKIEPGSSVLDIGCGAGAFLLGLPRGVRRTGLDHNLDALERLSASDPSVEVLRQTPAEHAFESPATYDVVTAFQVLEHLKQPGDLLDSIRRLVQPTGTLYISVPNADRAGRNAFEPLDHPPHHLSRWRTSQLETLGARHGFTLEDARCEPPDESVRLALLTNLAERRTGVLPVGLRRQAVRIFRKGAEFGPVERRLISSGFYERRHVFGHTLLAQFRPSGSS